MVYQIIAVQPKEFRGWLGAGTVLATAILAKGRDENMTTGQNLLTAIQLKKSQPGATLRDGGGLFFRSTGEGMGKWVYRFKLKDRSQREQGLGSFPAVTLATARTKAERSRQLAALGIDPIQRGLEDAAAAKAVVEAANRAVEFGSYLTTTFLPHRTRRLTNAKHIWQWKRMFEIHAATLWTRKLASITREDILTILKPIWETQHVSATRFRGRLQDLFDYAIESGDYVETNPALIALFQKSLSKPRRMEGKGPQAAMPYVDIPAFLTDLRKQQDASLGALALELTVLCASRSGEVRLAVWSEFDVGKKLWRIPASRMKAKKEHSVPLSDRALEILNAARARLGDDPAPGGLVFPGQKPSKPLSDATLRAVMKRIKLDHFTVHGFRSGFRDWCGNETNFPRELAEESLAHSLGSVEAAYRRGQAIERRRVMMDAWAVYCADSNPAGLAVKVVPLRAAAGGRP